MAFAIGWTWSISRAEPIPPGTVTSGGTLAGGNVTSSLTNGNAPTTAYLTDAALNAIVDRMLKSARGTSGKLKAAIEPTPSAITPDTLPPGGTLQYSQGGAAVAAAEGRGGLERRARHRQRHAPRRQLQPHLDAPVQRQKERSRRTLLPRQLAEREREASDRRRRRAARTPIPPGSSRSRRRTPTRRVSEHFKLRDFLTHDQPNVWPKYLVLQPRLIDKLELVLSDLQAHGIDMRGVRVMSGFRTPQYNYTGGNTGGRANLSRHMYGDASDIFIDNNGDGQMDDLNHDGKISIDDARVIEAAVDRVDAAHPELIGGAGVYTAGPGHGPFIHIDTRGYRARWSGTSGG